jgi:hypothetical protein
VGSGQWQVWGHVYPMVALIVVARIYPRIGGSRCLSLSSFRFLSPTC